LKTARRSVTSLDLEKFEQFRRKFDPSFANKSGNSQQGPSIKWPSAGNQASKKSNEEDDLYS
jgi:transitional endoplasmic reticulum ATPase